METLLLMVLLLLPAESAINPDSFAWLRPIIQRVAIEWEILDPREVRYVFTRYEDFSSDMKLLRRRYNDLYDAPPVCDCVRFFDRANISDLLAFNRSYRQHLDSLEKVEFVRWWELRQAIQETDRLYQVWDTLRDARCEYYYVTVRRQALKRLCETVGPENYYGGILPPHVPIWRFQRIE